MLTILNSAAVNTGVHTSLSIMVSSGYMPSSGIVGSCSSFIPSFFFKESPYCSPWWLYQFSVPPTMQIMPVWSKQRLATRFGHHEVESSLPPEGSVMARAHCHLYINILTCAIKVLACLVSKSMTCIFLKKEKER